MQLSHFYCVKMSDVRDFKALLNEKLAAMALDISELFDRMIEQHDREMRVLKQRNTRQQQLLDSVLKPRVVLRKSDIQTLSHCRVELGPRLNKGTEPPQIKEEKEELSIKQEQEEPPESTHTPVKSEDEVTKPTAIHPNSAQKHSTDGRQCLRSDKPTSPHSDDVKHTDNACDSEAVTETIDDPSTSSPGLDSISGHILSDSAAQDQSSSDTEDSDEWSPETQPGQALKRAVLKSRFGKSLKTKGSLDSSTRKQNKCVSDEGSEVIFECAQCRKTFLRKTCSGKHASGSTTYCSKCSNRLKQGNSVRRMKIHGQKKRFICLICKKGFTRTDNLSSHMLIHKGERPYSCTVCKKSFKERGHLKAHIRIHTGEKPFSCAACKKCFRHRATRDRHERNHEEKRPFSCSECGAEFKQKAHYMSHLVVHSGERPFSCSVCKKTYTRNSHVTSHMKVHAKKTI